MDREYQVVTCGVDTRFKASWLLVEWRILKMNFNSRSRSSLDKNPGYMKMQSERFSRRSAPYRDSHQGSSQNNLCKNCRRLGHHARECPNVIICHNCGLPGHIAAECTPEILCWNCREPGHTATDCTNKGICYLCSKVGHQARDCATPPCSPGYVSLCSNCYKVGHIAAECTNEKACNNCRRTGHFARYCPNDPVCNCCNVSGHIEKDCPKADTLIKRGGRVPKGRGMGHQYHRGHTSRDSMAPVICYTCGGIGHLAFECPSEGRLSGRYNPRKY